MPTGAGVASALTATGALASGGAGIAGTLAANKARSAQQSAFADLSKFAGANAADIFGTTPQFNPPDFNPLYLSDPGYRGIAADTISGDQGNLPAASGLSADINAAITKASRSRIEGLDPSFFSSLDTLYKTRNDTLKGRLPYADALAITSDRTRLANDLGTGGGSHQIAADLGLKQLDLMTNVGPNLMQSTTNLLNTIDPISRQTTPQDFLLTPSQTVPLAVQENQFAANFGLQTAQEQAAFGAMPNPQSQGLFNLAMMQAGLAAGNPGNGAASIFGALGNTLGALGTFAKSSATPATSSNFGYSNGIPIQYFGNAGYAIPKALPY